MLSLSGISGWHFKEIVDQISGIRNSQKCFEKKNYRIYNFLTEEMFG